MRSAHLRRTTRAVCGAVALAAVTPACRSVAQDETIEPDRPSVTNGPETVPPGLVQLETGLATSRSREGGETQHISGVLATLRLGVADHLELRVDSEPLVRQRGGGDATGAGDVSLGLKYRFVDAAEDAPGAVALAVLPYVTLPTAREPIGLGRPDFGVAGLASVILPWQLELDAEAGVAAAGQAHPDGYLALGFASASLQRELVPDHLQAYGELFYESQEERRGRDAMGFDFGLTYEPTKRLALDVAAASRVFGAAPDWMLSAGLSIRFPR